MELSESSGVAVLTSVLAAFFSWRRSMTEAVKVSSLVKARTLVATGAVLEPGLKPIKALLKAEAAP